MHHNLVIGNGYEMLRVYNNTLVGCQGGAVEISPGPGTWIKDIIVANNLLIDSGSCIVRAGNQKAVSGLVEFCNLARPASVLTFAGDKPDPFYRPVPVSPVIDAGRSAGLSVFAFSGSAPDVGAIEDGGPLFASSQAWARSPRASPSRSPSPRRKRSRLRPSSVW